MSTVAVSTSPTNCFTKAFDALDEKSPEPIDFMALRRKNFVETCDPVRGLAEDLYFNRNPSKARQLDL